MTIDELQIQLDISTGKEMEVLKQHARAIGSSYLFVDSSTGKCYLFNEHRHLDDIRKVKSIEDNTFYYCTSLKHIVIPGSVKCIGDWAFELCTSLESITIPDSVKSIGNCAFASCISLESITIPDSVESIGKYAFDGCTSLESIIIPDTVERIGEWTFACCKSLKEVIFKGKTMDQVKAMLYYPWSIKDTSIIKC